MCGAIHVVQSDHVSSANDQPKLLQMQIVRKKETITTDRRKLCVTKAKGRWEAIYVLCWEKWTELQKRWKNSIAIDHLRMKVKCAKALKV